MGSFRELLEPIWSELLATVVRMESLLDLLVLTSTQLLPLLPYVQVFRDPRPRFSSGNDGTQHQNPNGKWSGAESGEGS